MAQDPRDRYPYLSRTGRHAAPTIIRGTSPDGEDICFRFRWGRADLEINGRTEWNARYGDDYSSLIEEDDAFRLVAALLDARAAHLAILAKLPVPVGHDGSGRFMPSAIPVDKEEEEKP